MPSAFEDHEFDRVGFLRLPGALSVDDVSSLNAAIDRFPETERFELRMMP